MRLSGLILDLYDDPSSIKEIYPDLKSVPEEVKVAHGLSSAELDRLPDDVFALVMLEPEGRFRKYACVDKGNTLINIEYFLKHSHKLPAQAQKVAAQNLVTACGWYDLEPPEQLQKIAIGLVQAANLALAGPSVIKGTANQVRANLAAVNAAESPPGQLGGRVVTPAMTEAILKKAEATGSQLMPLQPPGKLRRGAEPLAAAASTSAEKSAAYLQPYVDTAAAKVASPKVEKRASSYALGESYGYKYPLDSYAQVKTAAQYFDEYCNVFSPEQRREYCENLLKRASELGIAVSDTVRKYGSDRYAPAEELKVALDIRAQYMDGEQRSMLEALLEKRAAIPPEVFCEALSELDKLAKIDWMYDSGIYDPYF